MKFRDLCEELKIVKMSLPEKISDFKVHWNDKFEQNHDMFSRIKRTGLTRKEAIKIIKNGIEDASEELKKNDGIYIIDFTESKFYLSVYMEKNFKDLNIKTILDYNMILRAKDRKLSVNEAEEMFNISLLEFYKDGFVNTYSGSLYLEESVDRSELDVWIAEETIIKIKG